MIGVTLLLATSALGIDYGWEPVAGGGIRYIIRIEPERLESLKDGYDISSDLPPNIQVMRSYRITSEEGPLPHQGEVPPIRLAANTAPYGAPNNVTPATTGWNGQAAYGTTPGYGTTPNYGTTPYGTSTTPYGNTPPPAYSATSAYPGLTNPNVGTVPYSGSPLGTTSNGYNSGYPGPVDPRAAYVAWNNQPNGAPYRNDYQHPQATGSFTNRDPNYQGEPRNTGPTLRADGVTATTQGPFSLAPMPLTALLLALFASLGANGYQALSMWDLRNRFRSMMRQMRHGMTDLD